MRRAFLCAWALAALAVPELAAAAPAKPHGRSLQHSPLLWSTVDICNTQMHPRTIGIRGSMPGSGLAKEKMFMRFRVQYRTPAGAWTYIPQADSNFIPVGAATFRARQTGRSFQVAPAAGGIGYVLRGVVSFEWRRGSHVTRSAQQATRAGHRTAAGADPAGYSAATCSVT